MIAMENMKECYEGHYIEKSKAPNMSELVAKILQSRDQCCRKPNSSLQHLLFVHPDVFIFFILTLVAVI
ncbi:hypothetical protein T07_5061 [Trichinella nelsoni]|uniref:Uncharacterized protein n=1 Tax=Trichinella nelsoni TaxID=6336 RepID=A0A0V0RE78_9BILA|nr:hypothetical protein T07_5061 [Trichinella nelsoni]